MPRPSTCVLNPKLKSLPEQLVPAAVAAGPLMVLTNFIPAGRDMSYTIVEYIFAPAMDIGRSIVVPARPLAEPTVITDILLLWIVMHLPFMQLLLQFTVW